MAHVAYDIDCSKNSRTLCVYLHIKEPLYSAHGYSHIWYTCSYFSSVITSGPINPIDHGYLSMLQCNPFQV